MSNKILFNKKTENVHSIWFPHRFLISGSKVTPKGLVDGPDPQVHIFRASELQDAVFGFFLFLNHFLCILAHVGMC